MITRENKELRATIDELNDQNRIVLQNYHNHVKNVIIQSLFSFHILVDFSMQFTKV